MLLDVDGTLVDSNEAHANAWAQTLGEAGFDIDLDRIRPLIGVGGDRLVEHLTGIPRDAEQNAELGKARSKLFLAHWVRHVRPIAGARELVLRLRDEGIRYAIASAATPDELEPLLEIGKLSDLMDIKTTSGDVEQSKPDPEIVRAALDKLEAPNATTLMLGDTPWDIRAANHAGIGCIAVLTGGWAPLALTPAVAVFSSVLELAHQPIGRWASSGSGARIEDAARSSSFGVSK